MNERIGGWTPGELSSLAETRELEIASSSTGRPLPIWVVVEADRVFVRTWQRRTTGWYGRAVASGRAWIRVAAASVEVVITPTAEVDADAVDSAYAAKYGTSGASSMVTAEAAASTLLLTPAAGA